MQDTGKRSEEELKCLTIDGKVHTFITSCFLEEAEQLIATLAERGVPNKLRPGRSYITRYAEVDDESVEEKRKAKRGRRLGVTEIWLVGEIEDADRTFVPFRNS